MAPAPSASLRSSRRTAARSRARKRLLLTRGGFSGTPALAAFVRAAFRRCAPLPSGCGRGAGAEAPPREEAAAAAAAAAALKLP